MWQHPRGIVTRGRISQGQRLLEAGQGARNKARQQAMGRNRPLAPPPSLSRWHVHRHWGPIVHQRRDQPQQSVQQHSLPQNQRQHLKHYAGALPHQLNLIDGASETWMLFWGILSLQVIMVSKWLPVNAADLKGGRKKIFKVFTHAGYISRLFFNQLVLVGAVSFRS